MAAGLAFTTCNKKCCSTTTVYWYIFFEIVLPMKYFMLQDVNPKQAITQGYKLTGRSSNIKACKGTLTHQNICKPWYVIKVLHVEYHNIHIIWLLHFKIADEFIRWKQKTKIHRAKTGGGFLWSSGGILLTSLCSWNGLLWANLPSWRQTTSSLHNSFYRMASCGTVCRRFSRAKILILARENRGESRERRF